MDVNNGFLMGKYADSTRGELLRSREDIVREIRSWLLTHFGSARNPRPITGELIKV